MSIALVLTTASLKIHRGDLFRFSKSVDCHLRDVKHDDRKAKFYDNLICIYNVRRDKELSIYNTSAKVARKDTMGPSVDSKHM